MSLTTSMSNALSGLAVASRSAQVVSSNVANATTEGYGVRVLEISARSNTGSGQGVAIEGVRRIVDEQLIGERRLAGASSGESGTLLGAATDFVAILGDPADVGSLSQSVADLTAKLAMAISRPDSEVRLSALLNSADQLAQTFHRMSDETQALRETADRNISELITELNASLSNVQELNAMILRATAQGSDTPSLLDARQKEIDAISALLPIRQIERANGSVALYTPSGLALLDTTAAQFGFDPTAVITADMTLASGALSGLSRNGQSLDISVLGGGRLAAEFAVRDDVAPGQQAELDALAADLVSRLSDPAVDPTLTLGSPGMFTDAGGPFDPLMMKGLAGRISVNAAVDPTRGGELWRLRDGIEAVAEGDRGDTSLLSALQARLSERSPDPVSGELDAGFPELIDRLVSRASGDLMAKESVAAFRANRFEALDDAYRAGGVNTDQEMQKLLLIERYYAANAKVIEVVDEMIGLLTRL